MSWVWVYRGWILCAVAGAGGAGFLSALWLRAPPHRPAPRPAPGPALGPAPELPRVLDAPHRLLPHAYWRHRAAHPPRSPHSPCVPVPQPPQLQLAAGGWQLLPVGRRHVYIYAAHWDGRFQEPVVRVLVYCDVKPLPALVCLLWYENEAAPARVAAKSLYGWRKGWGGPRDGLNEPYILACPAPPRPPRRAPAALSLVLEGHLCGTPTNILNVQGFPPEEVAPAITPTEESNVPSNTLRNNSSVIPSSETRPQARRGEDKTFCVCLKWLQFADDISGTLVEWIEFIKEFGASKLITFTVQVHPNVQRVLSYYSAAGFADVTTFSNAPQRRDASGRPFTDWRREVLPLNDCLYRARADGFPWIVAIDSDEIIVPQNNHTSWRQVVAGKVRDALVCRHYYFISSAQRDLAAPSYMHILGHRDRARKPTPQGYNVKSFHNTATVLAMHNHYPMRCAGGRCRSRNVDESLAKLHHYRARCGGGHASCRATRDTVRDDSIARFSHVAARVRRVLSLLHIQPDES